MPQETIYAKVSQFKNEGFHNSNHSYILPLEHNTENFLTPSYWALNTRAVREGDFITVRKEDFSYVALLYVRSVVQNIGITISVCWEKTFDADNTTKLNIDNFVVEFNQAQKFRIVEKNTKKLLEKNFQTKEIATEYLENLCK